jgi:hypothetical protein
MVLKERPQNLVELEKAELDWGQTKAWAWEATTREYF